ncbi:MAG: prepilin-type N-terminal cleavage/methylation domain-containing protein [Saccharofermentans sp.]|nr:prepilin-type N-terminal cleavage/methylation domain-containing protein [Saccharofermentans sp.]
MKKIRKSKKGFTLIEMILVTAILVILAAVLILNIAGYIERAHNAASSIAQHNSSVETITGEIDAAV